MSAPAKPTVIVDYGLGNLASVARALRYLGSDPVVTSDAAQILEAERVVLPGVGAFGAAMSNLGQRGLVSPLREYAATGRPLLGLCLGMQLLMEESDEGGRHDGLALVKGRVARLPTVPGYKVPHIGWSALEPNGTDWSGTILDGLRPDEALYFVHSYHVIPADTCDTLAYTHYGDRRVCAVISHGNLHGCQAHPEKSSAAGLNVLENFLAS